MIDDDDSNPRVSTSRPVVRGELSALRQELSATLMSAIPQQQSLAKEREKRIEDAVKRIAELQTAGWETSAVFTEMILVCLVDWLIVWIVWIVFSLSMTAILLSLRDYIVILSLSFLSDNYSSIEFFHHFCFSNPLLKLTSILGMQHKKLGSKEARLFLFVCLCREKPRFRFIIVINSKVIFHQIKVCCA